MNTIRIATDILPHEKQRVNNALRGYGMAVADGGQETVSDSLFEKSSESVVNLVSSNSEGGMNASVLGCNANNANAGRYVNANNAASNRNDNFAGAFAANYIKRERPHRDPQGQTSSLEDCTATGGYGRHEYELPLFADGGIAENDVKSLPVYAPNMDAEIWKELKKANSKTNLKGLRKFFLDKDIVTYSIFRCCEGKNIRRLIRFFDSQTRRYWGALPKSARVDATIVSLIAEQIIREIATGTYIVRGYAEREIERKHKTDKSRTAKVFTLYDRCVQMLVLTIIEQKLRNKVLRNNYSNIEGRGIFCNDKRYCMLNQLRTACWKYPDDVVLLTDIKKFYDNVGWKVVCGVVFETVKDITARWLIMVTLQKAGTLPIGSCLSPLFADILMNDYDMEILRRFKPHFFGAFGDNRCFVTDKQNAIRIQQFTKSYYPGRYGIELKGDYQIRSVSMNFSFCKTQYDRGFTRIRAELKRRAIIAAPHPQSFAGYNGFLKKTDSKHLLYLIKHKRKDMKDKHGMEIPAFKGQYMDFDYFKDHKVCITDLKCVMNHKDSGYYFVFQFVMREPDGLKLYNTHNGSKDIKSAGQYFLDYNIKKPIYVTVRKHENGKGYYFEEYYVSDKAACEAIVANMNIEL